MASANVTASGQEDSQRFDASLVRSCHTALVGIDTASKIASWSSGCKRLLGFGTEVAGDRDFFDLLAPTNRSEFRLHVDAAMRTGAVCRTRCGLVHQDGTTVETNITFAPVESASGTVLGVCLILGDDQPATAMTETDRDTNRADTADSLEPIALLANVSHELRTPMTSILGFTELLLDPNITVSAHPTALRTIQNNAKYLLSLINDVLDLAKLDAYEMTVDRQPCNPQKIGLDAVTLLGDRATAKGIELSFVPVGDISPTVVTDPIRLQQILLNLVSNAIKFTERGSVKIVAGLLENAPEPQMYFDVIDTGMGLDEASSVRIFEPFQQAPSRVGEPLQGTGLGLGISKRFAKLLGGDVRLVESEPGVGSRFRLTINTEAAEEEASPTQGAGTSVMAAATLDTIVNALANRRILVAEDGPDNQTLIRAFLEQAGGEVVTVADGVAAVEAALGAHPDPRVEKGTGERPFDIVLMDMQMPHMDGYEATSILRRDGYINPILALTAHALPSDKTACLEAGCSAYHAKPIDRHLLISTIASLIAASERDTTDSEQADSD